MEQERVATKHEISHWVHQSSPSCEAKYRDTHSLLVEGTSLQVCSSGKYSAIKWGKKYEIQSQIHTHLISHYFLVLITPGGPHILLVHSPVHVWDILVDQLHLLSIFFRNILHGYSNEQTLTTHMYTFYLTL